MCILCTCMCNEIFIQNLFSKLSNLHIFLITYQLMCYQVIPPGFMCSQVILAGFMFSQVKSVKLTVTFKTSWTAWLAPALLRLKAARSLQFKSPVSECPKSEPGSASAGAAAVSFPAGLCAWCGGGGVGIQHAAGCGGGGVAPRAGARTGQP